MTTIRPVTPETTSSAPQPVSPPKSLAGKIRWVGITGIVLAVLLSVAESAAGVERREQRHGRGRGGQRCS